MTISFGRAKKTILLGMFSLLVLATAGCHRTEDDFDDRRLAQRPHVETVTPENRKDIFRP